MNTPLKALAPALLAVTLTIPALAQIRMDTPAEKAKIQNRAAEDRKADTALKSALMRVKRLPAAQRAGLAATITNQSAQIGFKPQRGAGSSLFTNMAATQKDACIAYFATRGSRFAQVGFDVFKDDFVAKQLEIVALVFDGTKLGQLTTETMGKLKSGMYEKPEMQKTLDLIAGAVMYGYEQKGGSVLYSAGVGNAMAEGTIVGAMMDQPGQMDTMRPMLTKVQAKVAALTAPDDLETELASPIQAFAKGTFKDGDAAMTAASAVTNGYKTQYGKS